MSEPLPWDRLERTEAWGRAYSVVDYVYRPTTEAALAEVFDLARRTGRTVGFRGAGRSYGDASLNAEQILVDLSRMDRILEWDPARGVITVEPGVTIARLWRYVLGDGWWPPVVPGTMWPTLGGCLAMNVHGKNNWQAGPIGEHVLSFTALLPTGERVTCSPEENADLFYAMIGGLGLLGCFTRITLQMKRIYSGRLRVRALAAPDLATMLSQMEALKDDHDYLVGWVDAMASGAALGRGQIHVASYLPPGADPAPAQSLRLEAQDLPDTFFGLMPMNVLWRFMKPFLNDPGVRLVNLARYTLARRRHDHTFEQSLAAFNFLLDYVPGWRRAYEPGGLIQYQAFVPAVAAAEVFRDLLERCQAEGLPPYLAVLKRHRPDAFLLTHAVDGFSLALDFKVTPARRRRLQRLTEALDERVVAAGGRFYFAKDSTLRPEVVRAFLGEERLARFRELKARCDPEGLLQTNLARRLFPDLCGLPRPAPAPLPTDRAPLP